MKMSDNVPQGKYKAKSYCSKELIILYITIEFLLLYSETNEDKYFKENLETQFKFLKSLFFIYKCMNVFFCKKIKSKKYNLF